MSQSHSVCMACLLVDAPDKSASSASKAVQDICDIYGEELGAVPPDLILALRSAFDKNCVDEFWKAWSTGAEPRLAAGCGGSS